MKNPIMKIEIPGSDVEAIEVGTYGGGVELAVYQANDDGRVLIGSTMQRDKAIAIARAILVAAGVRPTPLAQGFSSFVIQD